MSEIVVFAEPQDQREHYLGVLRDEHILRQNLLYTTEGADAFYLYRSADLARIDWQGEYAFFERQPFWAAPTPLAFVSLGCGNAQPEKRLLRALVDAGHALRYVGVDSSRSMLELAQVQLQGAPYPRTFVQGDFTDPHIRSALDPLLQVSTACVYALIGGTFGNFNQTAIAEALAALLEPGEYLYLDVVPRARAELQQLRGRFAQLPRNYRRFFISLLERLDLPRDAIKVVSEECPEAALDALRYVFYFEMQRDVTLDYFGAPIPLEAGDRLEVLNIRAYDADALRDFLSAYGFDFVDEHYPEIEGLEHGWLRQLLRKA
jgi:hypothetical protein